MTVDLLVLGGGAAGMAAARTARRLGADVTLVQDGPVGGDCTFTGCVPSKTLIEAAAAGLTFDRAMTRVRDTVAEIAATETADVLREEGITVVEGRARLTGGRSVHVGSRQLTARRLVVATGSAPVVPPVPGLADGPYLTSDTIWDLRTAPASLVVLGGGAIGCEIAQAMHRLGVRVTLLEAAPRLLPREEPDAAAVIAAVFGRDGIDVRVGSAATAVSYSAEAAEVALADGSHLRAERLLVAVGRRPVTEGLDVEAARVAVDERGFIRTTARMRTSASGVYAAGDVTGRLQFTHAADEMGRVAAVNAVRGPLMRFHEASTPWVTFTHPEVARVGLTEEQATDRGARVATLPMSEVDRAVTAGETDGFITLLAGPRRLTRHAGGGRLLGATVVGPRAGEMVAEVALAMRIGAFTGRLAQTVHAYPTWSTGVRSAAAMFFVPVRGRSARPAGKGAAASAGSLTTSP